MALHSRTYHDVATVPLNQAIPVASTTMAVARPALPVLILVIILGAASAFVTKPVTIIRPHSLPVSRVSIFQNFYTLSSLYIG